MHQGWIPQALPCHIPLFCHRKGTDSFPKARRALAALIGTAVTHHYALGAKQGNSSSTLKVSESSFTALQGQMALGRALTILLLILGRCRRREVQWIAGLLSSQTGCVMLHEGHYSSRIFLPFLPLPDCFLGFLFLYQRVNNGTFSFSFGRPVLHMPWNPTLQPSFTIPKPFPFQPWLRATRLAPKGT